MFQPMPRCIKRPLVDAVKNFQGRHGRTADGKITTQTLADLNVPLSQRVQQMQLTLERWRWLPLGLHAAPIVANIPEFRLRAYDENFNVALAMNVVVGKAYDHDTPVFEDNMQYVVFRPYWNVPYSIAKAEFLPKLARDPDYLAKKGFEVVDSRQQVVTLGSRVERRAGATARRETFHPARVRAQEFTGPGEIYFSERLQRVHARYARAGILREDPAGFQPRLHPAGKARRSGGVGAAR